MPKRGGVNFVLVTSIDDLQRDLPFNGSGLFGHTCPIPPSPQFPDQPIGVRSSLNLVQEAHRRSGRVESCFGIGIGSGSELVPELCRLTWVTDRSRCYLDKES
jgi:hypothetical protein